PEGWPASVAYITELRWADDIPDNDRRPFQQGSLSATQRLADVPIRQVPLWDRPSPNVRIMRIQDSRHPACGEDGVFAVQNLEPFTYLMDYLGTVHYAARSEDGTDYLEDDGYTVSFHYPLLISGLTHGNEARFINDYRGISSRPNAFFETYRRPDGGVRVGCWTLNRAVQSGEEIVVTYGTDYWKLRGM
ncbi:hypothetical protein BC832DRAFT_520054, partial [Gaertneriomyces semiglobifer]